MLYYFNIIEASGETIDPEGTQLPSEAAAQNEARVIVSELLREFPGRFAGGAAVEVVSECGRRIMAVPILEDLE